ncbi:integral membrane protein [Pestalotiopsis sp. NC0098]|nr:integral membrane protein [Pestalotiopsis sp. NC0098]
MSPSRGVFNPSPDDWTTLLAVTAFLSIALYNFFELNTIIYTTFKRRSGLYFWSFLISTNGVAPYAIGFLLKDLNLSPSRYIDVTLIIVGWVCMVTGQSFVLYSRLHLIMREREKLRLVLIMIIVNGFVCHVPATVFVYGANSANPGPWIQPYNIFEKIEVTLFFIQETILSSIYIYQTLSFFRVESALHGKAASKLMVHLICINILIILLDSTVIALEYANFYNIQTAVKGLVYSIKLKLEFKVLNDLIELTKAGSTLNEIPSGTCGSHHCYCANGGRHDGPGGIGANGVLAGMMIGDIGDRSGGIYDGAKSERAESAYEVRIFSDGAAAAGVGGEHMGGGGDIADAPIEGGITVRTETEVSTTRIDDWENMVWPGLEEALANAATSRPVTRGCSRTASRRQSSEIDFAHKL